MSHPPQSCPLSAYERGQKNAAKQPCTRCLPGECLALSCGGCGAKLGTTHDEECHQAEEQRRAYYSQFLGADAA